MTSDACPTCGDLCGMREFGWEQRPLVVVQEGRCNCGASIHNLADVAEHVSSGEHDRRKGATNADT